MQHLNEEELVLHRYRDDGPDGAPAAEHLRTCEECRTQYETLGRVLALVDELEVPERDDDYAAAVWNRLRWRLGRRDRRRMWQGLAAAAAIALVFFGAGIWMARRGTPAATVAAAPSGSSNGRTANTAAAPPATNRVLLVVVGDHLDRSERMLLELTNADAKQSLDVTTERTRAAELVSANRLYRQTAVQNGDARSASLLADLEPVLLELAHADDRLSPAELASLQKRIDSKELLFKVRVMSAQAPKGTSSL